MTIAIATYERREAVCRLVRALGDAVLRRPELGEGLRVLVLVDGSTDGTTEALQALELPVPLEVVWQPNAGLATTRQRSLERAGTELVWFLDDDLVPLPDALPTHRRADRDTGGDHVLMGPCVMADDAETRPALRAHYAKLYGALTASGRIESFDQFSAANTSGPVALLRDAGGFDTGFTTYGREDFELGYRLLSEGADLRFDPAAAVVHEQERSVRQFLRNAVGEGANSVRVVRLHPETLHDMIPTGFDGRAYRALERMGVRRPAVLRAVSGLAAAAAPLESRLRGTDRLSALAYTTAFASGVAQQDEDGALLRRLWAAPGSAPECPQPPAASS